MLRLQQLLAPRYRDATAGELTGMIGAARDALGDRVLVAGHHFQRRDVLAWADAIGDTHRLAVLAQQRPEAEYVAVCGVRFMAEAVAMLTADHQQVVLPDLNAGCSMADMSSIDEVERAWHDLGGVVDLGRVTPVVYASSAAAMKAFAGRNGGMVCTATNAPAVVAWALAAGRADQVLFLPDQHLGRNTGLALGYGHQDMLVWSPRRPLGGSTAEDVRAATLLLWRAHCSVHQRFRPDHVLGARAAHPGIVVIAHPTSRYEVCDLADQVGSTDDIVRAVAAAPSGSTIALATEIHLVSRLAAEHPDKTVVSLDPVVCPCSTMNRIDLPHLAWTLEGLVEDEVRNQITVDADTRRWANVAMHRMLDIPDAVAAD